MDFTAKLAIFIFFVCVLAVAVTAWRRKDDGEPDIGSGDEYGAPVDPPPADEQDKSGGGGGPKPVR